MVTTSVKEGRDPAADNGAGLAGKNLKRGGAGLDKANSATVADVEEEGSMMETALTGDPTLGYRYRTHNPLYQHLRWTQGCMRA
jgi:hypothetical protein